MVKTLSKLTRSKVCTTCTYRRSSVHHWATDVEIGRELAVHDSFRMESPQSLHREFQNHPRRPSQGQMDCNQTVKLNKDCAKEKVLTPPQLERDDHVNSGHARNRNLREHCVSAKCQEQPHVVSTCTSYDFPELAFDYFHMGGRQTR